MVIHDRILEGLSRRRNSLSEDVRVYCDMPVSSKPKELEKVASDRLKDLYLGKLSSIEADNVFLEVYTQRGVDDLPLDDVITELIVVISFDRRPSNVGEAKKVIDRVFKGYPKFVYERSSDEFLSHVTKPEDVIDLLETLEHDGCAIKSLYSVVTAREVEDLVDDRDYEDRQDRLHQQRVERSIK